MPRSVRPHGAPGSLPGPHSTYQPASRSTNGSSQRPVPKNGTERLRHQSVRLPSPGSSRAIRVTAPRPSRKIPTSDRTTAGDSPSDSFGSGSPPPDAPLRAVERGRSGCWSRVERRRCATR